MEETSAVKPSVAELTGRFKGHALPMPMPVFEEKPTVPSKPKLKSSPLIEKLQANLALTPTPLLNSPKSSEGKSTPLCLISPCGPPSHTLRPPQPHSEDEVPVSFEQPAEGTPLPSINKSRVRLSFKRRPPTRQHRQSACEEAVSDAQDGSTSPCASHSPEKNGEVFSAAQEETEEDLEDSANPVTDPNTEQQQGQSEDESQDIEGNKVTQEEAEGEVAEAESSEIPQVTDPMEILVEEKPDEEQSPEEMEGVEEEVKLLPTEENREQKEQLV
ncbi:capZ-interacting protein isoform X2 [Astyanax mexicanus]|uniref:capZ-interacting protein isoform X2 n=1 Tax=Astyanax mexicanus TaxID=7994 RepID=UPI0020CB0D54|nr:capZ-interacting protein isoform X2 [Astyanax mexicanus]